MAGAGNLFLPSALPVRKAPTAVLPYHAHLVSSPVLLLDLDFIRPDHIAPCLFGRQQLDKILFLWTLSNQFLK